MSHAEKERQVTSGPGKECSVQQGCSGHAGCMCNGAVEWREGFENPIKWGNKESDQNGGAVGNARESTRNELPEESARNGNQQSGVMYSEGRNIQRQQLYIRGGEKRKRDTSRRCFMNQSEHRMMSRAGPARRMRSSRTRSKSQTTREMEKPPAAKAR